MKQVTIAHRGKQIVVELNRGQTASGEELPAQGQPMWHATIAGTALTKFPATSADTEESIRAKVLRWLDEHPDMLDRDQIVLGGG